MSLRDLLKKQPAARQPVYIGMLLLFLVGVFWGAREGFAVIFVPLGALSMVQFFYPTIFLWNIFYFIFCVASGSCLCMGLGDLLSLFDRGRVIMLTSPENFLEFFVVWVVIEWIRRALRRMKTPSPLRLRREVELILSVLRPKKAAQQLHADDGIPGNDGKCVSLPATELCGSTGLLYRRRDGGMDFVQICLNFGDYSFRAGIVGEPVDFRTLGSWADSSVVETAKALLKQKRDEGYQEVDRDSYTSLVIELPMSGDNPQVELEWRRYLENRMEMFLETVALGCCDGGSIGRRSLEVTCRVVDYDLAERVIREDLLNSEFSGYSRIYREDMEYPGDWEAYCMDREVFWELVEKARRESERNVDQYVQNLKDALLELGEAHAIGFQNTLNECVSALYRFDVLAANFIIESYVSDDCFESFRVWLVFQGRERYEKVLADVESIADWLGREDVEAISGEDFSGISVDVYVELCGEDDGRDSYYDSIKFPQDNEFVQEWPEGKSGFEERWPRLTGKFWNQERIRELHADDQASVPPGLRRR